MKPIVLAGCILLDDYNRILLLHSADDNETHWELPGAVVEEDDSPEDTAVQAAAQLLGIPVQLTKALGSDTFEIDDEMYQYHWFQAKALQGEPTVNQPDDFDDLYYAEFDDLPSLALSADMLLLEQKLFNGDFTLD